MQHFSMVKIRIQIPKKNIGIVKYHLEAEDNLGYLRVLSPHIAVLNAITSSMQAENLYAFLDNLRIHGYPIHFIPVHGKLIHSFVL